MLRKKRSIKALSVALPFPSMDIFTVSKDF